VGSSVTLSNRVILDSVALYGGTLTFVGLNNRIISWYTGGNYGKIVIGSAATFSTLLPTIPAYYEVVDLRTTIPAGDYNRT
jgi:hypothetical protein